MMDKPPRYLSYLLRLWRTDDQSQPIWRASLESPGTGERLSFADLHGLFKFLENQTLDHNEQNHVHDSHK